MKLPVVTIAAMLFAAPALAQTVDFGDDSGDWANDVECDDPRFEGPGMTLTPLLFSDLKRDASDCRAHYEAGRLSLVGVSDGVVDFGDDSGGYGGDGECDDMRFTGDGMAVAESLNAANILGDATDCQALFDAGSLTLNGVE